MCPPHAAAHYNHFMCGRFRLGKGREALKQHFGAEMDVDWSPRYNIAPTDPIPAVRQHPAKPERKISLLRWGLIPNWSRDASGGAKMINARAESAATTPAFRDALKTRRCLIPADGFYEWKKLAQGKQPYCLTVRDDSLFAFAGLWDRWRAPDGTFLETCSILTTSANRLAEPIHDRMPVIVAPENYDLWLDPGFKNTGEISGLLQPFPAERMRAYPVSTRVNKVENDDPQCAEPVADTPSATTPSLF